MKEKGDTGNVFLALNEITLGMQHKNEMESGIEENKRFEETVIFEKRRILEESRRDWGIGVWKYKLAFFYDGGTWRDRDEIGGWKRGSYKVYWNL